MGKAKNRTKLERQIERAAKDFERVSDRFLTLIEKRDAREQRFQQLPTAKINVMQYRALESFFDATDGEPWDWDEHPTMELTLYPSGSSEAGASIVLNGTFLRKDGEWSFAPQGLAG